MGKSDRVRKAAHRAFVAMVAQANHQGAARLGSGQILPAKHRRDEGLRDAA